MTRRSLCEVVATARAGWIQLIHLCGRVCRRRILRIKLGCDHLHGAINKTLVTKPLGPCHGQTCWARLSSARATAVCGRACGIPLPCCLTFWSITIWLFPSPMPGVAAWSVGVRFLVGGELPQNLDLVPCISGLLSATPLQTISMGFGPDFQNCRSNSPSTWTLRLSRRATTSVEHV
jgi:hypothetical protein